MSPLSLLNATRSLARRKLLYFMESCYGKAFRDRATGESRKLDKSHGLTSNHVRYRADDRYSFIHVSHQGARAQQELSVILTVSCELIIVAASQQSTMGEPRNVYDRPTITGRQMKRNGKNQEKRVGKMGGKRESRST